VSRTRYTLPELCKELGRNHVVVGQIQSQLELPRVDPPKRYSRGYACFLHKCFALRHFGVSIGDIQDLLRKEVKLIHLLNLDSHSRSPTWYLDNCSLTQRGPERLLLTGIDVGFDLEVGMVQSSLDFGQREPELFDSQQMGESLEQVLELYRKQRSKVRRRVGDERESLRRAMTWANRAFGF